MNAIDSALRLIEAEIPQAILDAAFISNDQRRYNTATSVTDEITEKVIRKFVLPDLNKFGPSIDINLTNVPYTYLDDYTRVFVIPESRTEGRNITDVTFAATSVFPGSYGNQALRYSHQTSRSGLLNAAEHIVASNSPIPNIMSADVKIAGPNTVSIRDPAQFRSDLQLRCTMEYSDNLGEIRPAFFVHTDKLIYFAVRRYIFNQLALSLDLTRMDYGRDFSRFKDIVDEMSDAGQLYQEQLPIVARAMIHNSPIDNRENIRNAGRWNI